MKIQNYVCRNHPVKQLSKNQSGNSFKNLENNEKISSLPLTKSYLAFLGGYSLNLKEVYQNLKPEQYPADIQKRVEEALQISDKLNLCDVHFHKYRDIENCFSLEELKEKYPEFQDVQSAYEVPAKEGSFLYKFQTGENEIFTPEEDLTLQLIKLYWGKGFSLSDLSKYIEENSSDGKGFDLHYTMSKKLNIPLMNSHYAQVLKLSNKEYNEEFTSQMSIKRKEAAEAKKQREEGEPVIIPTGELSEAHKLHISEGLKKYYLEHPEAIYKLTKRQQEFIKNNPQFKETMSEVMDFAWNSTQEGRSIKKYLSKFMKKFQTISDNELALKKDMTEEQKNALEEFWKKNPWASSMFSTAVKKGWDFVKTSPAKFFTSESIPHCKISLSILPERLKEQIKNWANARGLNIKSNEDFAYMIATNDEYTPKNMEEVEKYRKKFDSIISKFQTAHPEVPDKLATVLQLSLLTFMNELKSNSINLPNSLRENGYDRIMLERLLDGINKITPFYHEQKNAGVMPIDGLDSQTIYRIYSTIAHMLLDMDNGADIANYMNNNLNRTYDITESENGYVRLLQNLI